MAMILQLDDEMYCWLLKVSRESKLTPKEVVKACIGMVRRVYEGQR